MPTAGPVPLIALIPQLEETRYQTEGRQPGRVVEPPAVAERGTHRVTAPASDSGRCSPIRPLQRARRTLRIGPAVLDVPLIPLGSSGMSTPRTGDEPRLS